MHFIARLQVNPITAPFHTLRSCIVNISQSLGIFQGQFVTAIQSKDLIKDNSNLSSCSSGDKIDTSHSTQFGIN